MADKHEEEGTEKQSASRRHKLPRWVVASLSTIVGFLVLVAGLYVFYSVAYRDNIFPNVRIGELAVGGMTQAEARQALAAHVEDFTASTLPIQIGEHHDQFTVTDVGAAYDIDASVETAYQVGRTGAYWNDAWQQVLLVVASDSVAPTLTYDKDALTTYLDTLSTKFDVVEQNASFTLEEGQFIVLPPRNGQRFNRSRLEQHLTNALVEMRYPDQLALTLDPTTATVLESHVTMLEPVITTMLARPMVLVHEDFSQDVAIDQLADWLAVVPTTPSVSVAGGLVKVEVSREKVQAYMTTLAGSIAQEPVDAKLTIKDGKATVFQQSREGKALNEEASVEAVVAAIERRRTGAVSSAIEPERIELAVGAAKPTVSSETIEELGIKELIGTGETDFSGSPNNRIHNITTGTKYLNGWLIKPGETFSTVKALGAVDASTGYLPELVIKENRTIPEYGGGLCQVSTTLFRSVLNAGLKVTERRNHSYRVSYYEREVGPGLDATVYLPKPDFQFLNDTPGWILVQGEVQGNRLRFELYGTKDGRTAKIEGPFTLSKTPPPAAVYTTVATMAPGEVKQIEKPHEGARTTAKYIVTKDGKELFSQTFDSAYKALPARYLKGPDADTPTEPAPEAVAPAPDLSTETPPAETPAPEPAA